MNFNLCRKNEIQVGLISRPSVVQLHLLQPFYETINLVVARGRHRGSHVLVRMHYRIKRPRIPQGHMVLECGSEAAAA